MGIIDDYTNRAVAIAKDNSHGYSQRDRWGLITTVRLW